MNNRFKIERMEFFYFTENTHGHEKKWTHRTYLRNREI